ncbi:MAG: sugar phosphate isomerase/epimerase [Clostridia bacterium]|nr:sugar phosphate isomerase/epimerase [Clostridia bacterium]
MQISAKISEKLLPAAAQLGFCGTDESFLLYEQRERILSDDYAREMTALSQKIHSFGMRVCQTHMTFLPSHHPPMDGYEKYCAYFLPIYEKEIELTAQMGCPTAVMHPYFTEDAAESRAVNVHLIEQMLPRLESCGVILSLENIYAMEGGEAHHTTAEDMLYYAEYFRSPYVGICLDTGHAVTRRQNPSEMLKKVLPHLTALHLHATVPGQDLHALPYMAGGANWEEIGSLLRSSSYRGTFNLECKPSAKFSDEAAKLYYKLAYRIAADIIGE